MPRQGKCTDMRFLAIFFEYRNIFAASRGERHLVPPLLLSIQALAKHLAPITPPSTSQTQSITSHCSLPRLLPTNQPKTHRIPHQRRTHSRCHSSRRATNNIHHHTLTAQFGKQLNPPSSHQVRQDDSRTTRSQPFGTSAAAAHKSDGLPCTAGVLVD